MTLWIRILILSAVLVHAVAKIHVPTDTGVVNRVAPAAVNIDPDVPDDADKLGPGRFLPGPVPGRKSPASECWMNVRKLLLRHIGKETIHGPAQFIA